MRNDARLDAYHAPQRNWRQAIGLGLPLALFVLLVLIYFHRVGNREILGTESWELQATLLSLLLYLVVSAIAGYWFRFSGQPGRHGAWAGLRAGLVGALIVLIVMMPLFALLYLRFVDRLRTCQLHACGPFGPADYLSILGSLFLSLVLLNGAGVVLSAVGGWLGGLIAGWWDGPQEHPVEQRA
jgi:hypothetical protein